MRLLAALALLPLGVAVGLATVVLHSAWWSLGLAVLATVVTVYAVPAGWWGRLSFAVGYVGVVGYLTSPRPEGDYLISGDLRGYALLGLATVVLVVSLGTLPRPRSGHAAAAP